MAIPVAKKWERTCFPHRPPSIIQHHHPIRDLTGPPNTHSHPLLTPETSPPFHTLQTLPSLQIPSSFTLQIPPSLTLETSHHKPHKCVITLPQKKTPYTPYHSPHIPCHAFDRCCHSAYRPLTTYPQRLLLVISEHPSK